MFFFPNQPTHRGRNSTYGAALSWLISRFGGERERETRVSLSRPPPLTTPSVPIKAPVEATLRVHQPPLVVRSACGGQRDFARIKRRSEPRWWACWFAGPSPRTGPIGGFPTTSGSPVWTWRGYFQLWFVLILALWYRQSGFSLKP